MKETAINEDIGFPILHCLVSAVGNNWTQNQADYGMSWELFLIVLLIFKQAEKALSSWKTLVHVIENQPLTMIYETRRPLLLGILEYLV